MIWRYFPIGMRFPVKDFSDESKRACWRTAISALIAAGGNGASLYDAEETFDFGTGGSVYTCIACFYGIKQSRAVAKKLYALDALMSTLCLHHPFVQANYLESYGPYPILGKLNETCDIESTEAGASLLPKSAMPMQPNSGMKLLIASESIRDDIPAEALTRAIGIEASGHGFRLQRIPLANVSRGLVRSLVTALNGRYETVSYMWNDGEHAASTIGVLPRMPRRVQWRQFMKHRSLVITSTRSGKRCLRPGTLPARPSSPKGSGEKPSSWASSPFPSNTCNAKARERAAKSRA